jgi:hypothetical protein
MHKVVFAAAIALTGSSIAANPLASQVPAAAARDQSPAHQAAAIELAEVLAPDNSVEEQVDSMLKQLFDQLFASDPDFIELEKDYPGLRVAISERARPVLIKSALRIMPLYRAELAKLYGDNLTTAEMREATAFFRSPEMLALTTSVRRNIKFRRTTASAIGDRNISEADVKGDIRSSATEIMAELNPQQRARISAFMSSPLGRKVTALNPQKLALNTKWFNYSTPEMEKEIEVAMTAGMIDHIAKTDPAVAAEMRAMLRPDGTIPD